MNFKYILRVFIFQKRFMHFNNIKINKKSKMINLFLQI